MGIIRITDVYVAIHIHRVELAGVFVNPPKEKSYGITHSLMSDISLFGCLKIVVFSPAG